MRTAVAGGIMTCMEQNGAVPRQPGEQTAFLGPLARLSQAAWRIVLLVGLLSVALGIVVLVWPGATLLAVGVLFGLYLIVIGVGQLVAAFGTHSNTAMRVLAFISGTLCVVLGVFCFRSVFESVLLLAVWIGIGWLFRGLTQVMAASDPAMPARGWQAFLGVLNAIAGIVVISWPVGSLATLTIFAGCWLVVLGVMEMVGAFQMRHISAQTEIT
jgi:uncharacterized membrane protein HdeD (DUF308 family)